MGSIMAAWTCCHTDDELRAMFADLSLIPRDRTRAAADARDAAPGHGDEPGQPAGSRPGAARHDVRRVAAGLAPDPERQRLAGHAATAAVCSTTCRRPTCWCAPPVLASCAVPPVFAGVAAGAPARQTGRALDDRRAVGRRLGGRRPAVPAPGRRMLNINHFITSQANPTSCPSRRWRARARQGASCRRRRA